MKYLKIISAFFLVSICTQANTLRAQDQPVGAQIPFKKVGEIKTKSTSEIISSNWILGCETLDRDMADYEQYKEYIAPLGIKRLRMQAGWAKTERVKGQYDWAWLDKIIDDAASRGFQPWLETSYGNPVYAGGGGINLSAGIPSSEEALKAWDKWVAALVTRYKDKVKDWEVWNEPNFGDNEINAPEKVADLNIRTAEIIKRIQPGARISGLAMGHIDLKYADVFFKYIHTKGKMSLFDNMTYHDYVYNPDSNYGHVGELRRVLDKYAPQVKLRQGENGSPSFSGGGRGALGDYDWTELSQAKWNTRRMLGDLGHDIESSILGIIDMNYAVTAGPIKKLNVKGLIESDSSKRAIRPKMAYYAMQHIAAIFDDTLVRLKNLNQTFNSNAKTAVGEIRFSKSTDRSISVYGYEHATTRKQIFTIWSDEAIPVNTNQLRNITFTFVNAEITKPVYVDVITGSIYEIPQSQWSKEGNKMTFSNIPVYDAPILIADASLIHIK
ncbi:beta-galactosidase [Dyadobacter sp. CY107]|uniref:GH39 family glycosyl hydrolase n=1 Tax=Dyadobacter fanqingshengii TaxID=2906443 RepID=UPI001F4084C2|nr:beta-galactosidase [Dyadobacter fanqingshengii]MCF2505230.1 beta-galactosidase [Dyadobacter fanqingshengii]